ncbi:MAG: hypothetical protein KDA21_06695 [Phycisphaerales bacterium]|nr:hypothetical protein [Phycisphaerales bacterium]
MSIHTPFPCRSGLFARLLLGLAIGCVPASASSPERMTLHVDATDLPRNLVHAEASFPVSPGLVELRYVTWVPGNHGPSGPIRNIAGFEVRDNTGRRLAWDRDPTQVDRITVNVPESATGLTVSTTYIAGQPTTNSRSSDTYGRRDFGGLNWNTLIFYPVGTPHTRLMVDPSVTVPADWYPATNLDFTAGDDGRNTWVFESVPLATLVDSPVIFGIPDRSLRTYPLVAENMPEHYLHVVASDPRDNVVPDFLLPKYERMMREADLIFAGFPRDEYHFLVLLGEGLRFGLEHSACTYIGSKASVFRDAKETDGHGGGGGLTVIPHEYIHVWCGKLRAPEDMVRADFHTPARTELLWVYEGLTTYYTDILAARSDLITFDEYLDRLASRIVSLEQRTGRRWRSVEDTARSARFLRESSENWYDLRRGQDYYSEGAMFWLEADAIIREGTGGLRSLDDFCAMFFAVGANAPNDQSPFDRQQVELMLRKTYPGHDWNLMIHDRIERPQPTLSYDDVVGLTGYDLTWSDEPTKLQEKDAKSDSTAHLRASLGLVADKEGVITEMVPESAADRAGLTRGMTILGVNGWAYTPDRLREMVRHSAENPVTLIVAFEERLQTVELDYDGGLRYPRLTPQEGQPDLLRAIVTPRSEE